MKTVGFAPEQTRPPIPPSKEGEPFSVCNFVGLPESNDETMPNSDQPVSRREIANIELFRGIPNAALDDVRRLARRLGFAKDARVFHQGDTRIRAHALLEGSVRVTQSGSDGAHIVLRFIGPNEMFGATAAFVDRRYPADANAMEPSVEVSWSEGDLLRLMHRHPQIAINTLKIVSGRLHEAQERLRELSTQSVQRRIARTILRLVRQFGKDGSSGTTIGLPLRRKDIADIAGTTLYSASRALTGWEKRGLLMTRGQTLTVVKPADLRRIAEHAVG